MKLLGRLLLPFIYGVCMCAGEAKLENPSGQRDRSAYPVFSLQSKIDQCKGPDGPELFYNEVALPSVAALLDEGRLFFGVLMDKLESELAGAEKFEAMEKEWVYLLNVITQSFDLSIGRIESAWDTIIDFNDVFFLPWELRLSKLVFIDHFQNLLQEYKVVEAVVRAGTKELMTTLQTYLLEIMEKLEDIIFNSEEGEPKTEKEVLRRMEKAVNKLEPNFMGNLVKKILRKMRGGQKEQISTITFLKEPMDEIAITFEAYRTRGHLYPTFWADMSNILKGANGSMTPEEILHRYMMDEDFIVNSVVTLLSTDLLS